MTVKAIIMLVVRDGDKLNAKYLAWSDEKEKEFLSDNQNEAWKMEMHKAEEQFFIRWKNKDNEFPVVIPVCE